MSCQTTDKHNKFNDSNISSQKMIRHEIRKFARVLSCQTADKNNILKKSYSLHKIAPGYSEQTIPLKNKYPNSHLVTLSKPFHKKTTQNCTWLLWANPSTKEHYTNLRLVTASKLFHKKTLQKIASGYSEERLPQTHTTQTGTWLLWANRSTKTLHQNCIWLFWAALPQTNPYTNWHLATLSKSFHKKTLHEIAPGYSEQTLPKTTTQTCTWLLWANHSTKNTSLNCTRLFWANPSTKKLHKLAPGYFERTVPQKDSTQIAPEYSEKTLPRNNPTQTCTWFLWANRSTKDPTQNRTWLFWANPSTAKTIQTRTRLCLANRSTKRPYTKLHLVILSKAFQKRKQLYKLAPGYFEQIIPQKDPTRHCTRFFWANHSAKQQLHKLAPGYFQQNLKIQARRPPRMGKVSQTDKMVQNGLFSCSQGLF